VVPLQRLAQGGRWRTEAMRSYSGPILLWFTRGQGRITVAGVTRGFGAHNAVFLPAGTMHGFEVTAQVFGSALFFPQGTALRLPEAPQHLRFREATEQAELTGLIDNMQRELERDLAEAKRAVELHAGLLSVWLERQLAAQAAPEGREPAAKRLSTAYAALVEKDFRTGKTVAAFAAQLGVTPTHLTRSCNAACGHSAHDILADRIFFEARRLLRDTRMPVKDVAESLGFRSPAYFTRAFQKVAGETPTAFRKHR
jgi:AraC-like DNA-binding protein